MDNYLSQSLNCPLSIINCYEARLEARHDDLPATCGNGQLWVRAFGIQYYNCRMGGDDMHQSADVLYLRPPGASLLSDPEKKHGIRD